MVSDMIATVAIVLVTRRKCINNFSFLFIVLSYLGKNYYYSCSIGIHMFQLTTTHMQSKDLLKQMFDKTAFDIILNNPLSSTPYKCINNV